MSDTDSEVDSLFDEQDGDDQSEQELVASSEGPTIPGLFFFRDLLPDELSSGVLSSVGECGYFGSGGPKAEVEDVGGSWRRNQAMLFGRYTLSEAGEATTGLPHWADTLIQQLARLLSPPRLDQATYRLLFPTQETLSRQLILNLYSKGEGLSPHVDLLRRFGDGIILCSFGVKGQGTVMELQHVDTRQRHVLYLPPRSVLVLSREARYKWTHGIPSRTSDLVFMDGETDRPTRLERGMRLSVTIRWLLPGADVVGEPDSV